MSVLSGHGIPVNISENLSSLGTQSSGCFSQENLESYIAGAETGEATMNHAKETEISGTFDMSENDDFMLDQVPPPASTQTFRSNTIQPPATAAASSGFNDTQPSLLVTASGLSEPLIELAEAADRVPPSFNNQVQPNGTSPMRRRSAMLEVSAQSNSSTTRPPLQQTIQPSVAVSSSQQQISSSSSGAARNDKKVSLTKSDPTKIPVARAVIESTKPLVSLYDVEDYFSREITEDKSDGRGYGKRIYLPPAFDKDYFLGDREGVVNSLKRFRNEVHRIQEKSVGSLIEKFRDLSPADYNNQMIHHFGYDKIYSIYDTVKNVYHPYPSPNSPFQKTYVEPVESDDESDDDESESGVKEKGYKADLDMINVSVSGLKREHGKSLMYLLSHLFKIITVVGRIFVLCCVACGVYCTVLRTQHLCLHYWHRLLLTPAKQ